MLSHFQWKPLYENKQLPGWRISFYYKGVNYQGIYHKDGVIEWVNQLPPNEDMKEISSQVHELMLYHVYE
ncbi:YheE family protein [Bacillus timonensis]|nr:YheE family protein [Bacillus timonensis]